MTGEKKNTSLLILNVAQFVVILVLGYLLFTKNEQNEQLNLTVEQKNEEIGKQQTQLLSLKDDLERIKVEREKLGLSNDSLNAQIDQINIYLSDLKKENAYNLSQRKKLESFVADLKLDISKKDAHINRLTAANDSLTTSVDSLSKTNSKINDSLSNLKVEREHLQKDLKFASILKAQEFIIDGLKENGKNLSSQPFSKNKLSQVRISFTLADNKAAEHDKKRFYLRLITPSGECFSDKNNGGGKFTDHEGIEMTYTLHRDLQFENNNQFLTFMMLKGFNYTPGNYIVQIYCEGYDIGQGSFRVK